MRTIHTIPIAEWNKEKSRITREIRKGVALCGQEVYFHGTYESIVPPRRFSTEEGFRRDWIRCGKCLMHEDFAIHLLGDIDE